MRRWFQFPNPVNERVARSVALLVLLTAVTALVTQAWWLLAFLCAGFVLRVMFGPRVSPFALLATRVIAPRLGQPKLVPGPPKRFAQAIGASVTGVGAIAWLVAGSSTIAAATALVIVVATGLESIAGLCIGCQLFALLMRAGVIPKRICVACANASGAVELPAR